MHAVQAPASRGWTLTPMVSRGHDPRHMRGLAQGLCYLRTRGAPCGMDVFTSEMMNFHLNLVGLQCPDTWSNVIPGVSVTVCLHEINI